MQIDLKPLAINGNIVEQELKGELLIYDLKRHQAFGLNKTMAYIWKKCDGAHSVRDISEAMAAETKTPVVEDLIWLAIDELEQNRLLEFNAPKKTSYVTRREVIRRVGLMTTVTLPVLSILIAPKSSAAASGGRGLDVACNDNVRSCAPNLNCLQGHPLGAFCCNGFNLDGSFSLCTSDSQCCRIMTCLSQTAAGLTPRRCSYQLNQGFECGKNSDCFSGICTPSGGTAFCQ